MTPPSGPAQGPSIAPRPYPLPAAELPLPHGPRVLWLSSGTLAALSIGSHCLLDLVEA